jgi:xylulose-5-phosphate/fructose-6-phosphate phosphoketolase
MSQRDAVTVLKPGSVEAESTRVLGNFLRDVMKLNLDKKNFRLFGPDETASNRLDAVYEASGKEWMAEVEDVDINLSVNGRVMEVLSESLPLCSGVPIGCRSPPKGVLFACRFTVTVT